MLIIYLPIQVQRAGAENDLYTQEIFAQLTQHQEMVITLRAQAKEVLYLCRLSRTRTHNGKCLRTSRS